MTREEFYKLTDILNSEVLGNFMHGGEADELIAMFEEAVEHSNILEQEEPVSKELEVELNKYIKDHFTIDKEQLDRFGIDEKDYMYSMDKSDMLALVEHFTNWQKTKEWSVSDDFEMALAEMIDKAQTSVVEPWVIAAQWKDELIKLAKSEEPVSEDLEEASKEWLIPQLDKSYANYGEAKMMELTHFDGYAMLDAIEFGAKWQEAKYQEIIETAIHHAYHNGRLEMKEKMMAKLWKPADGDDLPEYEREVVVFTQNFPDDAGMMRVAIGHRPNPDGWDGKSLSTGKVEHYTPKTYDKGGWNIPNIIYWLDVELPKEIEL